MRVYLCISYTTIISNQEGVRSMAELKYEVVKTLGALSQSPSGWTKELNLVSWNDREPKYDIRDWAPDRNKMGKGITLTADEIILLRDILNELDL
jgi:hypothetical protein